jgi:hypothetical protein
MPRPSHPDRSIPVDPDVRGRAAMLEVLHAAHDRAAHDVRALVGGAPLRGTDDPRWFADPAVAQALTGALASAEHPLDVEVILWPHQVALLRAGDLPPGVTVYREPGAHGLIRRGSPFAEADAPGRADRPGRRRPCGPSPHGSAPCRTPLEYVADLGDERPLWPGPLAIDDAYQYLTAVVEARAAALGDVAVAASDVGQPGSRLAFEVRINLEGVHADTPLDEVGRRGDRAVAAIRWPLQRLQIEVETMVEAARKALTAVG